MAGGHQTEFAKRLQCPGGTEMKLKMEMPGGVGWKVPLMLLASMDAHARPC
jgi:hypothetical protein